MKKAFVIVLAALVIGCGGKTTTPPAPIADASGIWQGTFTSTKNQVSKATLNISQGSQSGLDSSGDPVAPLTAALTLNSPSCPAVTSGAGKGSISGHAVSLTFSLNDGGSLRFTSGINDATKPPIMFGEAFSFDTGTCSPQSGSAALSK